MFARNAFGRSVTVEVMTLDGWLAARPDLARRLAVIKIDVEGHEDRTVAGMHHTLKAGGPVDVICETSAGSGADRWLKSAGFDATILDLYDAARQYGNHLY
jgi:hypothetical protein